MIHSLAGGDIRGEKFSDFAKVQMLESANVGDIRWYTYNMLELKEGDEVVVPNGYLTAKAKVLAIQKNVSSFSAPVPLKHAKSILYKVENTQNK